MSKFLYCSICGKIMSSTNKCCPRCKGTNSPMESLFDSSYYRNKSEEIYGCSSDAFKILILEEAIKSIYFDKSKCCFDVDFEIKYIKNKMNPVIKVADYATVNYSVLKNKNNVPKCPTCNSTNIKKISTASKAFGAAMFGLFSKTAHSQFQCNNCGYKW